MHPLNHSKPRLSIELPPWVFAKEARHLLLRRRHFGALFVVAVAVRFTVVQLI